MSQFVQIYRDAENGEMGIRILDENGVVVETSPQVRLSLVELQHATQVDAFPIEAIFRWVHFTDADDGLKKRCYGLFTIPESDDTPPADSSPPDELRIGGGGCTLMRVVSYHQDAADGDYLVCRPPDGDEGGEDDVFVAVEPQLQSAIVNQTMPDGSMWGYSAYVAATQQRTATQSGGAAAVLSEYISPPFLAGDYVPVFACGNAGVTVGEEIVSLVALTGRQWASPT